MNINKKNWLNLLGIGFLLIVLAGAIYLVGQQVILQKQATDVKKLHAVFYLTDQTIELDIDATATLKLLILTPIALSDYKVSGVDLRINYTDSVLNLEDVVSKNDYEVFNKEKHRFVAVKRSNWINLLGALEFDLTFKALAPGSTTIEIIPEDSTAVGVYTRGSLPETEFGFDTVEGVTVNVRAGAGTPSPTITPSTTPTITPSVTPGITPSATPAITPSVTPAPDEANLQLKLRFQGIARQRADQAVKIRVKGPAGSGIDLWFNDVNATANSNGVYLTEEINLAGVSLGSNYTIFVKGPRHLARRFCQDNQANRCTGQGQITLQRGLNLFDFSGLNLEAGDLPDPEQNWQQDGVVNGHDLSLILERINSSDPDDLRVADIDLNGIVQTRDLSLLISTLGSKYDEDQ